MLRTVISVSTGINEGHAFAHLPQSMHEIGSRVMRVGLSIDTSPISAPYGHK